MDDITRKRLAELCPRFAGAVTRAILRLEQEDITVRVVSGLRTWAAQDALFAQGRTAPGPKVTNARGGYSQHNFGMAADCVPGIRGKSVWQPNWNPRHPDFVAMVDAMKDEGLVWGGDWHSLPDEDHFQDARLPVTPNALMRDIYARGGLQLIWNQFTLKEA